MRDFSRFSLVVVGLSVMVPAVASAQDQPMDGMAGYRSHVGSPAPAAPAYMPTAAPAAATPADLDGRSMASSAPTAGYSIPAVAPHNHKGKKMCVNCAAKAKQAQMNSMPGEIVRCEHMKNGVCADCARYLAMPGTVTMGSPTMAAPAVAAAAAAPAGSAPGRAVASSSPMPSAGSAMMANRSKPGVYTPYNPAQQSSMESMADPAPIGVVQAGYANQPNGPMAMPAQSMMAAPSASRPGRAVAMSSAGSTPYQPRTGAFPHPRIIGHLLGLTGIGSEHREEMAQKKSESHAMISYDAETAPVNEISASMLKKGR